MSSILDIKSDDDEMDGNYIFGIVDIQDCAAKSSPVTVYTNLRGIFLQVLQVHEEKLADSHEDVLLFLALILLHPGLPLYIRDKYSNKIAIHQHITEYKSDILCDAEDFLTENKEKFKFSQISNSTSSYNSQGTQYDPLVKGEEREPIKEFKIEIWDSDQEEEEDIWYPDVEIQDADTIDDEKIDENQVDDNANEDIKPKKTALNKKKKVPGKKLQLYCDLCNFTTGRRRYLREHKKIVHDGFSYDCEECEYKGKSQKYLDEHRESKHMGIRYHCDKCPASYSIKRNLKHHVAFRHEGKALLCDQCEFTTDANNKLQEHIRTVHLGITTFLSCDQCPYTAKKVQQLKLHMESKHGVGEFAFGARKRYLKPSKKYMCDQCPFKTSWEPFLSKHMDVKHGAKVYACEECTFTCTVPNEFRRHQRYAHKETGGKFPCDQCDYAGTRADALRLHIASQHEGIRYPCDSCSYSATTKGDLGRHRQAVHERVRFPCDYCEFTSAAKAYTKRHMISKHGLNTETVKNEYNNPASNLM